MILEFLVKISIKNFLNIKRKIEYSHSLETVCFKTCRIDQDFQLNFGHNVHIYICIYKTLEYPLKRRLCV